MLRTYIIALAVSALVVLGPEIAHAAPVVPALAAAINAAAGLAAGATFGFIAATVLITVAQVGLSLAISALTRPDSPRASLTNLSRQLSQPNSLPPVRHVYGRALIQGSPAPWRVKNNILYGCLILNSRESDGGSLTLRVDGETLTTSGDAFDFTSSGGAIPTAGVISGSFKVWVGLGDQTGPPDDILSEAGDIFDATDAWTGLTVAWVRCDAGPASSFRDRWAGSPPEIEFLTNWSKVWDPRDSSQSSDDSSTWTFSENQSLCALDAEMQNPKEPLPLAQIDLDTYKTQADIADEDVPLAAGGTEKRYRVAGIVVFTTQELHSILSPLYQAGASYRIRLGGKRGVAPGRYEEPVLTLDDYIAPELEFENMRQSRRLTTYMRTTFVNENVGYEDGELEQYTVPGAAAEDGGKPVVTSLPLDFVPSATQAMRITKIEAYNSRRQRSVKFTAFPEAMQLVNGSSVKLDIDGLELLDGVYRVEGLRPVGLASDNGMTLRVELNLLEWFEEAYNWTTAEEFEVTTGDSIDVVRSGIIAPTALTFTSGSTAALDTGGGVTIPRLLVTFPPSTSQSAESYEVEYRINGSGDSYELAGTASNDQTVNGGSDVFFYVTDVTAGTAYDIRVRTVSDFGKSDWIEELDVTVSPPTATVSAPTNISAGTPSHNAVTITASPPNDADFQGMTFWQHTSNDSSGASQVLGPVYGSPAADFSEQITGLSPSTVYYFWARSVDSFGEQSAFSASVSVTTDVAP